MKVQHSRPIRRHCRWEWVDLLFDARIWSGTYLRRKNARIKITSFHGASFWMRCVKLILTKLVWRNRSALHWCHERWILQFKSRVHWKQGSQEKHCWGHNPISIKQKCEFGASTASLRGVLSAREIKNFCAARCSCHFSLGSLSLLTVVFVQDLQQVAHSECQIAPRIYTRSQMLLLTLQMFVCYLFQLSQAMRGMSHQAQTFFVKLSNSNIGVFLLLAANKQSIINIVFQI